MRSSRLWIIAGLMALAIAAVGLRIATADPGAPTGADSNGGVFSAKLGL